ncbi:hypothetical protein KSP40_PGU015397 [Platanthera guangdongensis]|uniref:LACTB2 winged helix domain-containing protein n=1 Tax=Platanthera guangdongensis TaxID=2320717 RepID=A0ABR2LDV4_9ASPA
MEDVPGRGFPSQEERTMRGKQKRSGFHRTESVVRKKFKDRRRRSDCFMEGRWWRPSKQPAVERRPPDNLIGRAAEDGGGNRERRSAVRSTESPDKQNYGSAVLDITSGGNMKNKLQFLKRSSSTYLLLGQCIYFRHRRDREQEILKAIKNGAETLYDIVANVYANVDIKLWFAASSNVRLHVEHLAYQDMLPKRTSNLAIRNSLYEQFKLPASSVRAIQQSGFVFLLPTYEQSYSLGSSSCFQRTSNPAV